MFELNKSDTEYRSIYSLMNYSFQGLLIKQRAMQNKVCVDYNKGQALTIQQKYIVRTVIFAQKQVEESGL